LKKIAIISTHPIQYQVPLWQKMASEGIDLEVWFFTDFGTKSTYDIEFNKTFAWDLPMLDGYNYRFLNVNKNASPNGGFKGIILKENIKKILKDSNITHVYINGWQVLAYWQVLWAAKSIGLKTFFKGESNDLKPENKWKWPFKKLLLHQFFNRIDYFLYIGTANKRLYEKHGVTNRKLFPGLYCVDNNRFSHSKQLSFSERITLRKKWGIADKSFCFIFSGKFINKKRPLDIIKAAKLIVEQGKNIHLLFVGDGELYDEIKGLSNVIYDKENGITNTFKNGLVNISIAGFLNQTEIVHAYVVADALILPSDFGETWGLVVNEAMACELPCIVSNQCGSSEDLVKPIDKNLVFETGNISDLSRAMSHLLNEAPNKDKIKNLISQYSYDSTIQSVKEIIT